MRSKESFIVLLSVAVLVILVVLLLMLVVELLRRLPFHPHAVSNLVVIVARQLVKQNQ